MILYIYDRRYHPGMQGAWGEGLAATAPAVADPEEWRASARRLSRLLGTDVRTGIRPTASGFVVWAKANGGYPLGITDPFERDEWLRTAAVVVAADEADAGKVKTDGSESVQ